MMIYYKELKDLPDVTTALIKLYSSSNIYLQNIHNIHQILVVPDIIKDLVESVGLKIDNSKFFISPPYSKVVIHKDASDRLCALNIPIGVPTIGGHMTWYDNSEWNECSYVKGPQVWSRMAYPFKHKVYHPSEESEMVAKYSKEYTADAVPCTSLLITKPTIVQVDEWHSVDNLNNPENRIIYSLRFAKNPSFNTVVNHFAALINN